MRQKETAPADEPPVPAQTLHAIPTHVPSVRNDRALASDRVHRSVAKPHSLPSDANCRRMDYSAAPTPTPLPSSTLTAREQTQRTWKESVCLQADRDRHQTDRWHHTGAKPVPLPVSAMGA